MFKKVILPAVAATALSAVAAPALASHDYRRPSGVDHRLNQVEQTIAWGYRSGALSRHEAARLQAEARQVRQLQIRYARSGRGLDGREMADLNHRVNRLESRLRYEMRNVRYGPGYGPGHGYGRPAGNGFSITIGRGW